MPNSSPENIARKPLVVYHFPCPDGFGSAYAAWLHFGDGADYVGADYSYPVVDVAGRDVYVLDFSFPRETLEQMRQQSKSLVILDHHKTAQVALEGFPGATFDMNKCGARLSWEYFHPETPVPPLIDYLEDRDLWLWKNPRSTDFLAFLDTHPFDFQVWHELANMDAASLNAALEAGRHMNTKFLNMAEIMAEEAEPVRLLGACGHKVNGNFLFTKHAVKPRPNA